MRIASWHLTEMPGSHTVHLLLTQLHNAVFYFLLIFINFYYYYFFGNADDDHDDL